jgi:hypothetical protein
MSVGHFCVYVCTFLVCPPTCVSAKNQISHEAMHV